MKQLHMIGHVVLATAVISLAGAAGASATTLETNGLKKAEPTSI